RDERLLLLAEQNLLAAGVQQDLCRPLQHHREDAAELPLKRATPPQTLRPAPATALCSVSLMVADHVSVRGVSNWSCFSDCNIVSKFCLWTQVRTHVERHEQSNRAAFDATTEISDELPSRSDWRLGERSASVARSKIGA